MKRLTALPLLMSATFAMPASADMLGIWVGANAWNYDISGSTRFQSTSAIDDIDVKQDLGYSDDTLGSFYAIFEHPLPLIPNVKVSLTNIDTSANGQLTGSVTYGGKTFSASEAVSTSIKLDQSDVTIYWRLLDNIVNLDVGLNAKYIDGSTTITGATTGSATASFSTWVPMVYAGAGIDLPFSGLAATADGSYIGYNGSNFYDFSARVTYDSPWFVGGELGYRRINLTLDDIDANYADITFEGPFAGLYVHF